MWLTLDPRTGHEQSGRRPVLVLSPAAYNGRTGLAVVCPVTSRIKGYPFEVLIPDTAPVHGVVLADQLRSIDWRARRAERISALPMPLVATVTALAERLLRGVL
jgi:mRNA interferase MazF